MLGVRFQAQVPVTPHQTSTTFPPYLYSIPTASLFLLPSSVFLLPSSFKLQNVDCCYNYKFTYISGLFLYSCENAAIQAGDRTV